MADPDCQKCRGEGWVSYIDDWGDEAEASCECCPDPPRLPDPKFPERVWTKEEAFTAIRAHTMLTGAPPRKGNYMGAEYNVCTNCGQAPAHPDSRIGYCERCNCKAGHGYNHILKIEMDKDDLRAIVGDEIAAKIIAEVEE
jgi:hypothetical protein